METTGTLMGLELMPGKLSNDIGEPFTDVLVQHVLDKK